MNAHTLIQLLLGHAHVERNANALSDLASVGCTQMVANDLVRFLVHEDLNVSLTRGAMRLFVDCPLQRGELGVVRCDVIGAVLGLSVFLRETDATVLKGSEHGGRHVVVVH